MVHGGQTRRPKTGKTTRGDIQGVLCIIRRFIKYRTRVLFLSELVNAITFKQFLKIVPAVKKTFVGRINGVRSY